MVISACSNIKYCGFPLSDIMNYDMCIISAWLPSGGRQVWSLVLTIGYCNSQCMLLTQLQDTMQTRERCDFALGFHNEFYTS